MPVRSDRSRLASGERAVSTAVNYVVLLGVLAVLVSVVIVGTTDYVGDQRERVIRSELEVLGNRLAADLTTADTLAASTDEVVTVSASLPETVARSHYRLSVADAPGADSYALRLSSSDPAVSVTVPVKVEQDLATGSYAGGELTIRYDGTGLEVSHD